MATESGASQAADRTTMRMSLLVVLVGFTTTFLSRGIADSYIVFLVALEGEFGWSRSSLTGVYSVYVLATGLSAPVWGYCFDRFGPRATYSSGFLILGIDMLLASQASELWHFYMTAGVLAGIAASALGMVPASNLISRWFSRRRSTAMASAHAGFGVGMMVVLPAVQLAIDTTGWRTSYFLLGTVLLALLPVVVLLPWRRLHAGSSPHVAPSERAAPGPVERIAPAKIPAGPTLRQAMAKPEFWLIVQIYVFTAAGMYGVIIQIVAFLVDSGLTPLQAASVFGTAALLSVIGVLLSGVLADLSGYRLSATISFCGTALGILALLAYSYETYTYLLWAHILLFGLSQGARGPIVSTMTTRVFAGRSLGTIYGAIFLLMSIGAAAGAFGAGLLHDLTGSYRPGFIASIGCIVIAAAPFWCSSRLMGAKRG